MITAPLLIVSDIHMIGPADPRADRLLRLLASIDSQRCHDFVLLGDIFDYCFGASGYIRQKFAPIGAALTQLAARGTRVHFVPGNHEFHAQQLRWPGVRFCQRDSLQIQVDGDPKRTVAFTHGDLLLAPWSYRAYRSMINSRPVAWTAQRLPQALLERFALDISSRSRARSRVGPLPHQRILAAGHQWLQQLGVAQGVFGHFHQPYDDRCGAQRLLCLPSWDEPNALASDGQRFQRYHWQQGAWQADDPLC